MTAGLLADSTGDVLDKWPTSDACDLVAPEFHLAARCVDVPTVAATLRVALLNKRER